MMRRFSLVSACVLMVLLGTGCDLFGDTETPNTIAGTWRGTVTTQDSSYTLTLNLEQPPNANLRRSSVSGDGSLVKGETSWDFTISGTITRPNLTMTLRFETARPANLQGTVDEALETIEAELFGGPPSFDAATITLRRQ